MVHELDFCSIQLKSINAKFSLLSNLFRFKIYLFPFGYKHIGKEQLQQYSTEENVRHHKYLNADHNVFVNSFIDLKFERRKNLRRSAIGVVSDRRPLTVASISVTRVTKGSKLRVSTTRWSRRSKIAQKTPPEFSQRIF